MRLATIGSAFLASYGAASNVQAQEVILTGDGPHGACAPAIRRMATPARWEWSYWVAGGAVRPRGDRWDATAGVGAELDTALLRYPGFPAHAGAGIFRNEAELRLGVWSAGAVRPQGGLVESGAALNLSATGHAVFGTFGLRVGSGYGAFGSGRSGHGNITLTYGLRAVSGRYLKQGSCEPEPIPKPVLLASVARLFVTYRRAIADGNDWETVVGLELSPTFLLPPYQWSKLAGGWSANER